MSYSTLGPAPLLSTDRFEAKHQPLKEARKKKRCSVNPLSTVANQDERLSVYHSTGQMIPTNIEKRIKKQCHDKTALSFLESYEVSNGVLYECSTLKVFQTNYQKEQFVLLPGSKNSDLLVGKIEKLLCCSDYGYLLYRNMQAEYCPKVDLLFVKDTNEFDVIPTHWLCDPRPLQVTELE